MRAYLDRAFFIRLLQLAIPVSLQFLLHSSRYITDMLMLGRLGEGPLAAVGLCTNIHMVVNSVVFGFSAGVGILCAQFFGAKDRPGLSRTVNLGAFIAALSMLPVVLLMAFAPESIMRIGTNQPAIIATGASYLRITAVLPPAIGFITCVAASLNAMGKPHINFLFTLVAVVANVFLNWVFIFGHLGAPALGVAGAAVATVLSVGLEVAFIAGVLLIWKGGPRMSAEVLRSALRATHVRHFLRISVPLTVGGVVWHTGAFVYQAVYGHLGETELAVISMVQPVRTILFAFFWGISSATGVILGHHLGAGEFEHAWHRSKILIVLGIVASLVAAGLVTVFEMPILSLFAGLSPDTLRTARDVLMVMLLTIPILAANVVGIVGVLQSGADTRFVLAMDVFCQWAVGIPLCWLAAFHFDAPLHLVYLAAFGEEIIKVFIWVPRWATRAWVRRLVNAPLQSGEEQKRDEGEHGDEDEPRVGHVAEE